MTYGDRKRACCVSVFALCFRVVLSKARHLVRVCAMTELPCDPQLVDSTHGYVVAFGESKGFF